MQRYKNINLFDTTQTGGHRTNNTKTCIPISILYDSPDNPGRKHLKPIAASTTINAFPWLQVNKWRA